MQAIVTVWAGMRSENPAPSAASRATLEVLTSCSENEKLNDGQEMKTQNFWNVTVYNKNNKKIKSLLPEWQFLHRYSPRGPCQYRFFGEVLPVPCVVDREAWVTWTDNNFLWQFLRGEKLVLVLVRCRRQQERCANSIDQNQIFSRPSYLRLRKWRQLPCSRRKDFRPNEKSISQHLKLELSQTTWCAKMRESSEKRWQGISQFGEK